MPSRGKYLRRKFSSRGIRRRKRMRRLADMSHYAAAVLMLAAVVFLLYGFLSNRAKKIDISVENVAAFKIPHRALAELKAQSDHYGVDFAQAVSLYSVEHSFFPNKTDAQADIEPFMRDYAGIREGYRDKDLEPYYNMLNALLGEIKYFPIPSGCDGDDSASYMYGDGWDAKNSRWADIIDRENIRGRIPVVSMTAGVIEELGWKEKTGYQIVVRTAQDTRYTYSYLDSFADGLATGAAIQPGALLGHMGAVGSAPVRLRLAISPNFSPEPKDFYINPYPFLRLIEESKAE